MLFPSQFLLLSRLISFAFDGRNIHGKGTNEERYSRFRPPTLSHFGQVTLRNVGVTSRKLFPLRASLLLS